MYNTNRSEVRLPIESREIRQVHLDFHLGDLLPPGMNYTSESDVDLVITMHYVDTDGRSRRKSFTLYSTDIKNTF
jgi:hypothetical protein